MNKRQIIASLNNIANELDLNNLYKEANTVTKVMTRLADEFREDYEKEPDSSEFREDYEKEPDSRYAAEIFKDEVQKLINAKEFSKVYPVDKKLALITLWGYLKSNNKNSFLQYFEDEFIPGQELHPKDKLNIDLMRFARSFFKEMNLREMDYKYLDQAVGDLI